MKWLFIVLASILIVACDPFGPLTVAPPVAETLTPTPGVVVAASRPAASPTPDTCRVVSAETAVFLRNAPGGDKIMPLPKGETLISILGDEGKWKHVKYHNVSGYVYDEYINGC